MKNIIINILLFFIFTVTLNAQNKFLTDTDSIYNIVDVDTKAEYPGGEGAFNSQVLNKFRIPELKKSQTYKIFVSYVIEKDGSISNIKVVKDPGCGLAEEAVRLFSKISVKWSPAMKGGKPVRTSYYCPITIKF